MRWFLSKRKLSSVLQLPCVTSHNLDLKRKEVKVDHLDLNIVDWYLSWYMSNSVASVAEELYVLQ